MPFSTFFPSAKVIFPLFLTSVWVIFVKSSFCSLKARALTKRFIQGYPWTNLADI